MANDTEMKIEDILKYIRESAHFYNNETGILQMSVELLWCRLPEDLKNNKNIQDCQRRLNAAIEEIKGRNEKLSLLGRNGKIPEESKNI